MSTEKTVTKSWIQTSSGVCGGEPCVRNTRHTVAGLVEWKKQGLTDACILEHHPDLTPADLEAAWEYYTNYRNEIDRAISYASSASLMAQLYADEDFSYPVVQQLRQLGHSILTAHEAGQAGQGITDEEVLAFAQAAGRAVVTFNRRHFIRLHSRVSSHAGIIVSPVMTMLWL